jgi:hypothetical protein
MLSLHECVWIFHEDSISVIFAGIQVHVATIYVITSLNILYEKKKNTSRPTVPLVIEELGISRVTN